MGEMIPLPHAELVAADEQAMVAEASRQAFAIIALGDDASTMDARQLLTDIHEFHKLLEDRRVVVKAPFLDATRQVDGFFRPHLDKLTMAKAHVTGKLSLRAIAIENERKRIEDENERLHPHAEVAPITQEVVAAQASAKLVKTREFKRVELVDESLLPREYLTPHMQKISADVIAGKSVPGARLVIEKRATT